MDPVLGQLMLFAFNWVPQGFLPCDGRSLPISQYQALYSLIGTAYGGNTSNFNLPDLRGRVPMCQGQGTGLSNNYTFAQKYGTETTSISVANMPPHTHTGNVTLQGSGAFQVSNDEASYATPSAGMVLAGASTNAVDAGGADAEINIYANYNPSEMVTLNNALNLQVTGGGNFITNATGGGQPVANIPPVLAMTWAICWQGLYPSRPY